ncbi:hypothetical protein ACXZ9C_10640 [Streptococcus agalactiae]
MAERTRRVASGVASRGVAWRWSSRGVAWRQRGASASGVGVASSRGV